MSTDRKLWMFAELEQQLKLGNDENKHVLAQLAELQGQRDALMQKMQESQRETRKSVAELRQEQDAKAEPENQLQHMTAEVDHQRERIKDAISKSADGSGGSASEQWDLEELRASVRRLTADQETASAKIRALQTEKQDSTTSMQALQEEKETLTQVVEQAKVESKDMEHQLQRVQAEQQHKADLLRQAEDHRSAAVSER